MRPSISTGSLSIVSRITFGYRTQIHPKSAAAEMCLKKTMKMDEHLCLKMSEVFQEFVRLQTNQQNSGAGLDFHTHHVHSIDARHVMYF